MQELSTTNQLIEETRDIFSRFRRDLPKAAQNLFLLREKNEYEGAFGHYASELFGIPESMISKLITNYESWVLKAGFPLERLRGADYEKIYAGTKLLESGQAPEEVWAKVLTLTRSELRQERQETAPCAHESIKPTCTDCWQVDPLKN